MSIQLVPEHPPSYFPGSEAQLGQYVAERRHLLAFLGSLMAQIRPRDPLFHRLRVCAQLLKVFPRVERHDGLGLTRGLRCVDAEPDDKARAKVLEYVVYKAGPLSSFDAQRREYACSVRQGSRRLVEPNKKFTLDAAFLGTTHFEGHECKLNPLNYLHETGNPPGLSARSKRKLEYLTRLHAVLVSNYGFQAVVSLTGLVPNVDLVRDKLRKLGFNSVEAMGPADIEKAGHGTM